MKNKKIRKNIMHPARQDEKTGAAAPAENKKFPAVQQPPFFMILTGCGISGRTPR